MDEPLIEELSGRDPELIATLSAAGLPTDDLAEPGRRFFRFADGGRLVGFIGWESTDERRALLRSLVVVPAERGKGAGQAMSQWALTRLAELGFAEAYLLTTSVEALARRLGFARIGRDDAPAAIRASRQYAGLCPRSAILLHRRLP